MGCVLLLQSHRPIANPSAFGAAFLLVYTQIALAALLGGAGDPGSTSKQASHWVGLVIGVLFLAAGIGLVVRRPKAVVDKPRWVAQLENASPRRAFSRRVR